MVGREAVSGSASVVAAMLSSLDFKKQQEGYVQDPIQETTSVQNPVLLLCMVPHHLAKDWLKQLHWFDFCFAVAKSPPKEMGMMDPTACTAPASTASSQPPCKDAWYRDLRDRKADRHTDRQIDRQTGG